MPCHEFSPPLLCSREAATCCWTIQTAVSIPAAPVPAQRWENERLEAPPRPSQHRLLPLQEQPPPARDSPAPTPRLVLVPQHARFIAGADSEGEQEGPRWPRRSERQAGGCRGRVTAAAGGGGITVGVRRAAGQGQAGRASAEDAGRREGKGCHLPAGAGPGPSSSPTELQGWRPRGPWP